MLTYLAAFLPVLILLVENPTILSLTTFPEIATLVAKIGGFAGLGLISVNVLLSSRNGFLDKLYGGLDQVYVVHHGKGLVGFVLILLHPAFLALRYIEDSFGAVLSYLLVNKGLGVNLGVFALLLFVVIIILTFMRRLEYQSLLKTHRGLGVVLLVGASHAFIAGSNAGKLPILRAYLLVLVSVSLLAYINTSILGNAVARKYRYIVDTVKQPSDSVIKINMNPVDEEIQYSSGQFVFPLFKQEGLDERHPFSFTSSPGMDDIELMVRPLGDFTDRLSGLKPGTSVVLEGPYGGFDYRKGGNTQIWIAGGIGITPFISMVRELIEQESPPVVDVYYSYRLGGDASLSELMRAICENAESLRFFEIDTKKRQRLTVDEITENSQLMSSDVFMCGPIGMIDDFAKNLVKHGVRRNRIFMERFRLL